VSAPAEKKVKLGILGAGMIATFDYGYLPNVPVLADKLEVAAIADMAYDAAQAVAGRFGIRHAYDSLDAMLAEAPIDAVLNLTPIPVHAQTSLTILRAGKHLATEKPLATTLEDGREIVNLARERDLTVVCSPPQLLYPSRREARRLVREGAIGRVAFARVRSSHNGPAARGWPADPTWFYEKGSGPLYDMGVYGLHEITGILGPAKRVSAFAGITDEQRVVRGGPFHGKTIDVTADDNVLVMLDFGDSCFAVVDATFNVSASKSPKIEIFGRKGTINVNLDWSEFGDVPPLEVFSEEAVSGLGGWITPTFEEIDADRRRTDSLAQAVVLDHLADCILGGKRPVLSAEHALHVLEIMLKAEESARTGQAVELTTTFEAPEGP
jgi:predicted dehydrogenase